MKIAIEFDSCWQTSFLGDDEKKSFDLHSNTVTYSKGDFKGSLRKNYHALDGYEQKFVATTGTRGEKYTPISKNTILGVLCRLIGDQRPLWKAKQSSDFYFSDIEDKILKSVIEGNKNETNELVYLTNKSDDRCTKNGYIGVLDDDNPWFFSAESLLLWSVLYLDKNKLLEFILSEESCKNIISADLCKPTEIIRRVDLISDLKSEDGAVMKTKERQHKDQQSIADKKSKYLLVYKDRITTKPPATVKKKAESEEKLASLIEDLQQAKSCLDELVHRSESEFELALNKAVIYLSSKFPNKKKLGEEYCKDGAVYPMSLYSAALYLQAERLVRDGVELPFLDLSKSEILIQGFSKAGFNGVRDWLNKMAGGHKKAVGTPCYIKKHSGKLEIEINLSDEDRGREFPELTRGQEIQRLIENAGVSSFYLGKKGLAYVSSIRL
ncbi:TPA: type I-Fv CRISPR-associated protein Cas5fv [Vibrio cholerae]